MKTRGDASRVKHPRCEPCLCCVCRHLVGSTVLCNTCHLVSVHRKCGNFTGSSWTCPDCLIKKDEGVKKDEKQEKDDCEDGEIVIKDEFDDEESLAKPIKLDPVLIPRPLVQIPINPAMTCFSIPEDRLQPEAVYKRMLAEASADEALMCLLCQKQGEYRGLHSEFEGRKLELHNAKLGDQEFRLALFRLQEMHLQALARLKKELGDQLQSARLFGFEGIKCLKGDAPVADPPFKEIESYHLSQRSVVEKLLSSEFQQRITTVPKGYQIPKKAETQRGKRKPKEMRSMGSILLNPGSGTSVFALLGKTIGKVKGQAGFSEDEMTIPLLNAVVKGAFDGSLSLFEGFRGGSTDPTLLEELLVKIRHKY